MATLTIPGSKPERRYDLDWLRVLAILVVFIFHSSRFFDHGDWHVKNATLYLGVDVWITFLGHWMMPLIFVISGASTFYALGTRGLGKYVKDRALRLLVPLVVGIFTHVLVQVYLERLSHRQFSGTLIEFIPHYFEGWYAFGGNFAWMGLHLWYLEILFVFSLLLLPLFVWLKHGGGQHMAAGLARFLSRPVAVYLLSLPIVLLLIALDPASVLGNRGFGGWALPLYAFFFVYGFLLVVDRGLQQAILEQRWLSLTLGGMLAVSMFGLWTQWGDPGFGTPRYALTKTLFALSSWCWILAILGFGLQHLTFNTPWLPDANEAVLPFYVMHQSVLIYVGYFVVQWPLPDLVKWLIIAATSLAIVAVLYEFVVRRVEVLRFLFGMRPLPKSSTQPRAEQPARLGSSLR